MYVDGFLLPVPKKNLKAYMAMSRKAAKIWMEHGALEYRECTGDDLNVPFGLPFPKRVGTKSTETVLFSWIVYKSKAHRDKVNKAAMADPRLAPPDKMPFDPDRMSCGGFKMVVDF